MNAPDIWIFHMNFSNRSIKKSSKYLLIAVATRTFFDANLLMIFLIWTQFQNYVKYIKNISNTDLQEYSF